jgi:putative spermidine/putrescine transport system ATP-binding protein
MATLDLQGIRKVFGATVALEELSLSVGSGELVSLLGPSGCGKTTALRIVAGFEAPTAGDLLVDGKDFVGVAASKRNMGMVFQAYSLFPNMTARQNVEFGMRMRKKPRAECRRRAEELLGLVGLAERVGNYPHELSGGQQQRVALARALAIEPAILLLDEPLSALDAKVRVELRQQIRGLQTRLGITTLYVTHDQEEALSISDRIAVMSQGNLEQVGAPADIYRSPRTEFVANFVGLMNGFDGRLQSSDTVVLGASERSLHVTEVNGCAVGDSVLVLIRPESIELSELADGAAPPQGTFEGKVLMHTFLGSVTRVSLSSDLGDLVADEPSLRALTMPPGTRVAARVDPVGVRMLKR